MNNFERRLDRIEGQLPKWEVERKVLDLLSDGELDMLEELIEKSVLFEALGRGSRDDFFNDPDLWSYEQRELMIKFDRLAAGIVIYDADDPGAAPSGGTVYLPDNGRN